LGEEARDREADAAGGASDYGAVVVEEEEGGGHFKEVNCIGVLCFVISGIVGYFF